MSSSANSPTPCSRRPIPIVVVVAGPGEVDFQGDETFSGGLVIDAGVVGVASGGALGSGGVTFAGDATLRAYATVTLANPMLVSAGAAASLQAGADDVLTLSGPLTLRAGGKLKVGGSGETGEVALAVSSLTSAGAYTIELAGGVLDVLTTASLGSATLRLYRRRHAAYFDDRVAMTTSPLGPAWSRLSRPTSS